MKETVVSDHLAEQITIARKNKWCGILRVTLLAAAIVISGMAVAAYRQPAVVEVAFGICVLSAFLYIRTDTKGKKPELDIWKHGKHGEDTLRKTLRRGLGNEYTAFFGVPVGGRGDLDCIVVGPDSIFAIESKHHKGLITQRDGDLVETKIGRRGTPYQGKLRRPVHQLSAAIHEFKEELNREGIDVWLEGVLAFTHRNATVEQCVVGNVTVVRAKSLCNLISAGAQRKTGTKHRDALISYLNGRALKPSK